MKGGAGVRQLLAALVFAACLGAPSASLAFDGPWYEGHEPKTIEHAGVTTTTTTTTTTEHTSFVVGLSSELTCPSGQPQSFTVIFSTAKGNITATMAEPCSGTWQPVTGSAGEDVSANTGDRDAVGGIPSIEIEPARAEIAVSGENLPFVFEVVGLSGVVAQEAVMADYEPPKRISQREIDEYINTCIDGSYEVHARNEGELYCEVPSKLTYIPSKLAYGHLWPEAPEVRKPEPKYYALKQRPRAWITSAISTHFSSPHNLKLSHCAWKGTQRVRCDVAWSSGGYRYTGWVEVGKVNVYTGHFTYGLRVTKSRGKHHRTVSVLY